MRRRLEALRAMAPSARSVAFRQFVRDTTPRWKSLATYLMRRWRAPCTVTEDDVVQELLLGAWRYIDEFDASKGVPIDRFVVFNACALAKRFLHAQRQAYRRDDRSPSLVAMPFSSFGDESEGSDWFERHAEAILGSADDATDAKRTFLSLDSEGLLRAAARTSPTRQMLAMNLDRRMVMERESAPTRRDLMTMGR